jgi:hypothetical protein
MIEETLKQLTEALIENTAAIKQHIAVLGATPTPTSAAEPVKPAAKKPAAKKPEVMPDPEPEGIEEPAPEETTEPEPEVITPTKVAAPKRQDDTPNVPSTGRNPDGSALAAEHVDVDEVIAEINATVKGKLMKAADPEVLKDKWSSIRKGYGVDRIADLKGNPSQLLAALKQAKAL